MLLNLVTSSPLTNEKKELFNTASEDACCQQQLPVLLVAFAEDAGRGRAVRGETALHPGLNGSGVVESSEVLNKLFGCVKPLLNGSFRNCAPFRPFADSMSGSF